MSRSIVSFIRVSTAVSIALLALSCGVSAQGPLLDAPMPSGEGGVPLFVAVQPRVETSHKFWDRQNKILLLAVAAGNAADFAVTRANLQSGGRELNPMVRPFGRSSAGLAVNFAGETVGVVGLSYFFHKTGHHKLERAVSMLNVAASTTAVSYGLMHR